MNATHATTMVVGHHVVRTSLEAAGAPRAVRLCVRVDDGPEWSFDDEPGWREVGYGTADSGVYVWLARRLIAFRTDDLERAPLEIETDDDILVAFASNDRWLLVCETTLRLLDGAEQVTRIELPEVVDGATWDGDRLRVRNIQGESIAVRVIDGGLVVDQ